MRTLNGAEQVSIGHGVEQELWPLHDSSRLEAVLFPILVIAAIAVLTGGAILFVGGSLMTMVNVLSNFEGIHAKVAGLAGAIVLFLVGLILYHYARNVEKDVQNYF